MSDVDAAVVDLIAHPPHTGRVSSVVVDLTAELVRPQVTLSLGSIPHEARQGGLGLALVDATPPVLYLEVFDPATPDAPIVVASTDEYDGTLGSSFEQTFTDVFNGEGRLSLKVMNDDPIRAELRAGRMVRVRYRGVWAFLAWIGPTSQQTLVQPGDSEGSPEESDECKTVEGVEALGAFVTAVMYPDRWLQGPNPKPKQQDRQFNAGSAPFDDSLWDQAKQLQRQGDRGGLDPPVWDNYPPAFPDPDAWWVAGGDGNLEEAPPLSTMFVRRTCVVGTIDGDGARSCRLYYGADDFVTVFVDAQQMSETLDINSRYSLRSVDFDLSDGEHHLFFVVGNIGAWEPYNPMGLVYTLQEMVSGEPIGVIFDSISGAAIHSSSHDKVLWNPAEPPGITAGQILLTSIFEMIARGGDDWWEWDFTVYTDSNGNPWPTLPNWVTSVGGDYREAFRALMSAGFVDLRVDPYRPLLHAYVGATFTQHSGVTFGVPVENVDQSLSELTHGDNGPRANVLLVEFANGRIEVESPDVDFDVTPRVEGSLNLGRVPDETTARTMALAVLETSARNYQSVAAGWEPHDDSHEPWVNPLLVPGNTVDVANADLDGVDRVLLSALTVTADVEGLVVVSPELADLADVADQLTKSWLERAAPNQLGGVYPIGSLPAPVSYGSNVARVPGYAFSLGSFATTERNTPIHVRLQLREVLFHRWSNANTDSTVGVSEATIYLNGDVLVVVEIDNMSTKSVTNIAGLVGALQPGLDSLGVVLTTSNGADHTLIIRTEYL